MKFVSIFVLIAYVFSSFSSKKISPPLRERFIWPPLEYNLEEANFQINKSLYNLKELDINRIQLWKHKLFIGQWTYGFQITFCKIPLSYVNFNTTEKSPKLIAYPRDLLNSIPQVSTLEVDICDRLWLYDNSNDRLYIIDLNHNKLIRNFTFTEQLKIQRIIVDANISDCDNAYVYIVDKYSRDIVVYKLSDNKHWTTREPIFVDWMANNASHYYVYPTYRDATLTDLNVNGSPVRFLQLITSDCTVAVPTNVLKNFEKATSSPQFMVLHMGAEHWFHVMHYDERNSILFFGKGCRTVCWNMKRFPNEFSETTTEVLWMDNQFKGNIKQIVSDGQNNLLIVTSHCTAEERSCHQLFTISIKELIKGTLCDPV